MVVGAAEMMETNARFETLSPRWDDVLGFSLDRFAASFVDRDSVEPADTHIDLPTRFSVRPAFSPATTRRRRRPPSPALQSEAGS
jgi:hypothetical protein